MRNSPEVKRAKALPLRAPDRLTMYRRKFAEHLERVAKHGTAANFPADETWRNYRYDATPAGVAQFPPGTWQRPDKPDDYGLSGAYCMDRVPAGWRVAGNAYDIQREESRARDAAQGWYTDDMQHDTCIAVVLQLPARDGFAQYVPAIYFSGMDGVHCWPLACDRESTALDAARAAQERAAVFAEAERDYQTQENAKFQAEEAREAARDARAAHSAICRELRDTRADGKPALCAAIRARLASLREEFRDQMRRVDKLTSEPWSVY